VSCAVLKLLANNLQLDELLVLDVGEARHSGTLSEDAVVWKQVEAPGLRTRRRAPDARAVYTLTSHLAAPSTQLKLPLFQKRS
jgi:hypothetical protein